MINARNSLQFIISRRLMPAPFVVALMLPFLLGGCSLIVSNVSAGMADDLSAAILNQDDPELVREALPAYLLLMDSMVASGPDNPDTLGAAAQLYAAYGAAMVDDAERAKVLTTRARSYGSRALCAADSDACDLDGLSFDDYAGVIEAIRSSDVDALYSFSLANLAWIRANSDDYKALAALPKVEVALQQVMRLDPGELAASTSMYLGILNTLRPAALGGDPEAGREWFEKGIELSDGKDLGIKVEFARGYARMLYDRELHDRLLNDVLAADPEQPGLTLFNLLAQDQARALLASADDYF